MGGIKKGYGRDGGGFDQELLRTRVDGVRLERRKKDRRVGAHFYKQSLVMRRPRRKKKTGYGRKQEFYFVPLGEGVINTGKCLESREKYFRIKYWGMKSSDPQ